MALTPIYNRRNNNDAGLLQTYYGGVANPNPVANTLGNGGGANNTPSNATTGFRGTSNIGFDPATGRLTLNGEPLDPSDPRIWGSAGYLYTGEYDVPGSHDPARAGGSADSAYYDRVTSFNDEAGNTIDRYRLRQDVRDRLGNRVQLRGPGVWGGGEGDGWNEVIDPSKVVYDEEFGLLTTPDNIREDDPASRNRWRMARNVIFAFAAAAAGGLLPGTEGGLFGSAANVPIPGDMIMPSLTPAAAPGVGGVPSLSAIPNLTVPLAGAPAVGAAVTGGAGSIPAVAAPDMTMPTLTGAANPPLSDIPSLAGGSAFPPWLRAAGGILGSYLGNRNANNTANQLNANAQGADPWGPYRGQFAEQLVNIYKDPKAFMEFITSNPAYQFALEQGQQSLSRKAMQAGQGRGSDLDYKLQKYASGLASQTWNAEIERIMKMAGVNIDPNASLNTRNQATMLEGQGTNQMWNQLFGVVADPDVRNWLAGLFG